MIHAQSIFAVDAHTTGTPIRLITGGIPPLKGQTVTDKMNYMRDNHDWLRTCIMQQPRGFLSLVAGVLTPTHNPEADYGLFFMDALCYQPMCGAGSLSVAKILVETGMVNKVEPQTKIVLETPSGLITLIADIQDGIVTSVSLENIPAFLYRQDVEIDVPDLGKFTVDIVFGGNFFIFVDVKNLPFTLSKENVNELKKVSKTILKSTNDVVKVEHPTNPAINYLEQVLFVNNTQESDESYLATCVFGDAQVDISPCGTGTSARIAQRYFRKQLKIDDTFKQKSIYGGIFTGKINAETSVNGTPAIIPYLSCSEVHITGYNHLVVEANDKLKAGFTSW